MSSIVYLKNKTNGKTYAYLNESIWDSEKKRCKCKRKCLGHVDPVTGEIVPNKRNEMGESATVRSMGATFFLRNISDSIGLTDAVRIAIPDDWELFMSCVFFLLIEKRPLADIVYWAPDNDIPYKGVITNEALKSMLEDLNENTRFTFFREWRDRFDRNDFCNGYIAPVASYDNTKEVIRFNDLPLVMVDKKINISMTMDSATMMPVSFNLTDMKPRTYTEIKRISNQELWLDYQRETRILDDSFYSEDNFMDLLRLNERFIIKLPIESKLAKDSIERVRERVMDLQYARTIMGESFFVMSFVNYYAGKKCYMHILFSTSDAEKEFSLFLELINDCKHELENNVYIPEHDEFYRKYFIIRNHSWGKEVEENGEAIMSYNHVAGFVIFMSNSVKNAEDVLSQYLAVTRIQSNFENMKNKRDRINLDVANDNHFPGRVLLQFCAQILTSEINQKRSKHSILKGMSFTDVIMEMGKFKKMSIPGFDTPFYTNINNSQSKILKAFDIDIKKLKEGGR